MNHLNIEYYQIREDFSILNKLSKQIDSINELRRTYPDLENTLSEVEAFLTQRYSKLNKELMEKIEIKQ